MAPNIAGLKRRLVLNPDDVDARVLLGEALLHGGDYEGAARQLQRASELCGDAPGVWLLLGRALEQARRPQAAAAALRQHLRRQPDDEGGHESLAELLALGGFLDEALLHSERAARLSAGRPERVPRTLRAVELCRAKGLEERALCHLRLLLRCHPGDERVLRTLRDLHTDRGDEEEVERLGGRRARHRLLAQARREAAWLGDGGGVAGEAARALCAGDLPGARRALRSVAPPDREGREPRAAYLRVLLSIIDSSDGEEDSRAERLLLDLAAELAGQDQQRLLGAVLRRLGDLCRRRAQLSEAAARYRRAILLDPQEGQGYAELGDVLGLLGERAEAAHAYEAARERGGDEDGAIARRLLALALNQGTPAGDDDEDLYRSLQKRQRGPEVGRIHVLGVCLLFPGPRAVEDRAGPGEGEPVPLFGVVNELQAVIFPGSGEISCTGLVGPELLDEARTAAAFVKAQADKLGIKALNERDVHLHFVRPRNEGRSGGLAQLLAVVSVCTGRPVRQGLAASGSVTPLGEVHRVDGVREKLLGAYHAGMRTVMLPRACLRQVREAPREFQEAIDHLEILYVDSALEACARALQGAPGEGDG